MNETNQTTPLAVGQTYRNRFKHDNAPDGTPREILIKEVEHGVLRVTNTKTNRTITMRESTLKNRWTLVFPAIKDGEQ